MLNESAIIGIILLIVFSAACIYLYSHITYLTKKLGFMESVTVDMRMAIDTLMTEELTTAGSTASAAAVEGRAAPVASIGPAPTVVADDEHFYSSVLEQAHEAAPVAEPHSMMPGAESLEAVLSSFSDGFEEVQSSGNLGGMSLNSASAAAVAPTSLEEDGAALLEAIGTEEVGVTASAAVTVKPNYDAMTRAELTSLADQRGLRVKKSMSRGEIVSLLRRSEPKEIQPQATGVVTAADAGVGELISEDSIPMASE